MMHAISRNRFNAYLMLTKAPLADSLAEEIKWYANTNETILGVVFRDRTDGDYCFGLFARDECRKFRATLIECGFASPIRAKQGLNDSAAVETQKKCADNAQEPSMARGSDLFSPVVPPNKLHPSFDVLATGRGHSSGREIIQELMPHFEDVDGNFVEQFQTTGFDARLWELYLFTYFREERLEVFRPKPAPDFRINCFGDTAYVEAVIVGQPDGKTSKSRLWDSMPKDAVELRSRLNDEIPIRFGSPLFSKLKKKYWKREGVSEAPLIFAIADFHASGSMTWTSTALFEYLYGARHEFAFSSDGQLIISPLKVDAHEVGNKKIPSGFFYQQDAEHISAVLFSNSGTISKFTRMGKLAGFGDPDVNISRNGMRYKHDPNAATPLAFSYAVDPLECSESWGEGLSVFHNPRAVRPLSDRFFPSIAHHRFEDGLIRSQIPDFHPFVSVTLISMPEQ